MPHDETTAQSTVDVPAPDPELQRLGPLLGSWRSEDHTDDSVLGPGVPVTSVETFDWLEGGYFLVHTYETVFGDEPAQKGVNYCGYDTDAKRFRIIFFSNNGPFTEQGNRYQGAVGTVASPSKARHASSTGSMTPDRSCSTLTARSRSPGGCATTTVPGSRG